MIKGYFGKMLSSFSPSHIWVLKSYFESGDTPTEAQHINLIDSIGRTVGDQVTVSDDLTLTAADTGKTFLVGTDAKTITLPSTAAGLKYTFINIGAATTVEIIVSPASADGIAGTVTLAATVVVLDGTVDKDAVNTKGTTALGDSITIEGTGNAGTGAWIVTASTGIWAQGA